MFEAFTSRDYKIYSDSILVKRNKIYFLVNKNLKKYLVSNDPGFELPIDVVSPYNIYEKTHVNALKLRRLFKHLNPQPCGLKKSFGFGDRLGIATPGHILAFEKHSFFPVLAQQSMREMNKTNRTMKNIIDDAMWGVFQTGYKKGYGADIDHVKNKKDIIKAIKCGYTMYTIDSSDHIDENTKSLPGTYSKAIKHIAALYNIIKERTSSPFDFEVSIDETNLPTTPEAHRFIVEELRRNKVEFNGLALRFIGKFEKGIDYIGNLKTFKKEFLEHAAICKHYSGYKLSIHSGSDKFSIYPIIGRNAETFHVKTAGTSWLEAVRLIGLKDPKLFRKMYQVAVDNFEESCKAYHITTALDQIPGISKLSDKNLPKLLDENASRQLVHISYGVLLKNMGDKIYNLLNLYEKEHYQMLENHLGKHLELLKIK